MADVEVKKEWITVVVTAYNAGRYIHRCIESVLGQYYPKVKVIVVDDCSTDNTREVVRVYPKEKVKYVRLNENSGPAVGRNTGLRFCDSEYVAFLDSDDYWHEDFLKATTDFLRANVEAIAVCTGHVKKDWKGFDHYGPLLDETDSQFYSSGGAIIPDFFSFWSKYLNISTGTVLMRTKYALATGGQRADLRLTQDLEFWGYLGTSGKWGFIPKNLFITDQRILTVRERLEKIKKRYTFFTQISLSDWEKRIIVRLNPRDMEGYQSIRSYIATIMTIANAYSFKFSKSYELSCSWGIKLGPGLGSVLRCGAKCGPFLFPLFCLAIRIREYIKAYSYYFCRFLFSFFKKSFPKVKRKKYFPRPRPVA